MKKPEKVTEHKKICTKRMGINSELAEAYSGNPNVRAGCGLCQSGVPCEGKNPIKSFK